ncbi:ABC transporter ATP-binding protein [Adlercreutzia sp. ZJ138]|uniref:ABC transporter ATP-binding protein n=1 Tax=Adlercreutzia sp. ZJ138 TaxID=2709405 RepID=UPI0013ED2875|nr:ABC transporter ATP-binding protein [Adlercreutzia sp. ZJ138]
MEISLRNINLTLRKNPILQDVSMCVPSGEFVSILGKSGAGKSTLLSVISGLLLQDSGEVYFDGECVDAVPTHKRDVSVVFQDARLFPNMNVLDNVAFPLKMRGVRTLERRERARAMLAEVQLQGLEQRRTHELSGGQRQRVALARALVCRPHAVLLDEPFSGLDEEVRDNMRDLVLKLHERHDTTIVMVTHDGFEALRMSDQIAYLSGGRIIQVGKPADLLIHPATPEVVASFGQTKALEGVVCDGEFTYGKLHIAAPGVEGPAILIHTESGATEVLPLDGASAAHATGSESTQAAADNVAQANAKE